MLVAKCGRPVVSAHAGRVQTRKYQSAAGYYVVVDGKGTRQDYAYMHMSRKGRPKQGSRVAAGERIGSVNDTGRATGCPGPRGPGAEPRPAAAARLPAARRPQSNLTRGSTQT